MRCRWTEDGLVLLAATKAALAQLILPCIRKRLRMIIIIMS